MHHPEQRILYTLENKAQDKMQNIQTSTINFTLYVCRTKYKDRIQE